LSPCPGWPAHRVTLWKSAFPVCTFIIGIITTATITIITSSTFLSSANMNPIRKLPMTSTMDRVRRRGASAAIQCLLLAHAWATPIPYEQVPPAVQKGIAAQLAGGKLGVIDRDEDNGQFTYTFEVTRGGRTVDYTVDAAGALVSIEVTLAETPMPVQKTIQAQVAQGTLESVEKAFQEGKVVYDIDWKKKDGTERSFTVAEDGKLDSIQVGVEETPAAVQGAITKEVGAGSLKEVFKTFDENTVYYDATIQRDGLEREISIGENGKVESRQVFLNETPPPVQNMIKQSLGAGQMVRIDQVYEKKKGGIFEVEAVKDGKPYYFSVGPKGAFLGTD
jgi:uncharacterized membrane protein YkoI